MTLNPDDISIEIQYLSHGTRYIFYNNRVEAERQWMGYILLSDIFPNLDHPTNLTPEEEHVYVKAWWLKYRYRPEVPE